MNRRWIVVGVWIVLLLAYTFAAGFQIPPREGVADPEDFGTTGGAQFANLLASSTGGSEVVSLTPAVVAHGPSETVFIVGPERSPYPSEGDALERFMQDGGTVTLFASNTAWNDFLGRYQIQLEGPTLLPTGNRTSENLLEIDLPSSLGSGTLMLPNATAVQSSGTNVSTYLPEGETVLDRNQNGTIDAPPSPDQAGPFPVAAQASVGDGQLVVVASSDAVLGGGRIERNLAAVTTMVEELGQGEQVAFDAGTHPNGWSDFFRAPAQATMAVGQAWIPGLATLGVLGLGVVIALPASTDEGRDTDLDEFTPQTREVMLGGGD